MMTANSPSSQKPSVSGPRISPHIEGWRPWALAVGGCILLALATIGATLSVPGAARPVQTGPRESSSEGAYFQFDCPPHPETFVFQAIDPGLIQEARDILAGKRRNRHVMGTIVKQPAAYNPPWSYHLDPATVVLFDVATEVCDASIGYVEEHLDQACGGFLPNCVWCPFGSRLLAEVEPQATATPTPPLVLLHLPLVVRSPVREVEEQTGW